MSTWLIVWLLSARIEALECEEFVRRHPFRKANLHIYMRASCAGVLKREMTYSNGTLPIETAARGGLSELVKGAPTTIVQLNYECAIISEYEMNATIGLEMKGWIQRNRSVIFKAITPRRRRRERQADTTYGPTMVRTAQDKPFWAVTSLNDYDGLFALKDPIGLMLRRNGSK